MMRHFILIFVILFNLLNSTISFSKDRYAFEYDKYMSQSAGATDTKLVYDIFTVIPDKVTDSLRFKSLNALVLGCLSSGWGHELFGHGYPLRRYGIPREYNFSLKPYVSYMPSDNIINSQVYIGGTKFNKEYEDRFLKDGMLEGFDYRNSMIPFLSKLIYFRTASSTTRYGNDIKNYIDNLKKINPDTEIKDYLKDSVYFSTFSPLFLINSWILGKTFLTNEYESYKFNYMITFNFNLYPEAVTRELGISFRMPDKKYMRITYEEGQDVWGKKIEGFGLEYTNIPMYKMMTTDIKIHHVEKGTSNILLTLNMGHFYVRLKHQFKYYYDLEPIDKFSVGYIF